MRHVPCRPGSASDPITNRLMIGMRKSIVLLTVALSCLTVASCNLNPFGMACSGVGYDAVRVAISDAQGNPQALGAVVMIYDGTYSERDSAIYEPLYVRGAQDRGGHTYDIHVSKPHYQDVWVRGAKAPGGGCETGTVTVPVVLSLTPSAPPVRSVRLLPPRILIDRQPNRGIASFTPYVDANVGLSRNVIWRMAGDTASVNFDAATGTFTYRCLPKSGLVTVTALSVADSTVIGRAEVAVQGHPGNATDPPCS